MSSQTIIVQIDPGQLVAQKNNQYSLYLAKKVNGAFTVIWQSMGPVATVNTPSYEPSNTFNIAVPSFQINYTNVPIQQGSVTFTSSGNPVSINLGQTVALDANGIFGTPSNTGTAGKLIVDNSLQGNPNEILNDDQGNPIFVNVASGMDIGSATLTPIEQYQLWFDNFQQTGTIIANNVSNPGLVTFAGGTDTMTISYNASGVWQNGPLANQAFALDASVKSGAVAVTVLAYFTVALTVTAATYLASKLLDKFANNLKPTSITVAANTKTLTVTFANTDIAQAVSGQLGLYDAAVNAALNAAKSDPSSGLAGEGWSFGQSEVTVTA